MRITSLLIGLALVFSFAMMPSQAVAQAAPKVINVITYDVAGDMPKFLDLFKRAIAVAEQYGTSGKSRVWVASFAGDNTNTVAVATEYPDMVSMAQSGAKIAPSPEWQQLVREATAAGIRPLSNSVSVEMTP